MRLVNTRQATLLWASIALASAIDNVKAPDTITASQAFQLSFQDAGSDQYRIYLAAALVNNNGPTCYLENSTTISSPLTLTIPSDVGPSADYYSIALRDLSASSNTITYSNTFALAGATANYSAYEDALGGAQFWDPNALPCTAYPCARACAQASYPQDLTNATAYDTMKSCILNCPGVTPAAQQTAPAHESSTSLTAPDPTATPAASTYTGLEAVLTLASNDVLTFLATPLTLSGSPTATAALLGTGSAQLTLTVGGSPATISSHTFSLVSAGVAVDGKTTARFSTEILTTAATAATSPSGSTASVATNTAAAPVADTSKSAASRRYPSLAFAADGVGSRYFAAAAVVAVAGILAIVS